MNPWSIVGVIGLWVLTLGGAGYYEYGVGVKVTDDAYKSRDNIALTNANTALKDIEDKYRALEQKQALDLAAISGNYEKEKQDANVKTAELIAAARTGALRLYHHQTAGIPAAGSLATPTAAATGGCDGAGDRGFSAGDSEFLLALGGRANAVRDKLSSCQQIVRSDRNDHLQSPSIPLLQRGRSEAEGDLEWTPEKHF
jgi:hypothetical protein